jgi:hypothetical protein
MLAVMLAVTMSSIRMSCFAMWRTCIIGCISERRDLQPETDDRDDENSDDY